MVDSGPAILGISADYHDAAAALVLGGSPVFAAEEERFTRRKHDASLPVNALAWIIEAANLRDIEIDAVVFYSKPFDTFRRVIAGVGDAGAAGARLVLPAVATWGRVKLWPMWRIDREFARHGVRCRRYLFAEHHQSHAASAFYPSPFESAAVLTMDGVGEWTTTAIGVGSGGSVRLLAEQRYPHSVGLFYSAVTAFCGFDVNDGESKVMGLAPYGVPRYERVMRDSLVEVKDDGSVSLNRRFVRAQSHRSMLHPRAGELFDGPPRQRHDPLTEREADLAASAQRILEDAVVKSAYHAHRLTGERRVCTAGGVALNCVANQRLLEDGPFDELWTQPAAGDSGGALGAALWAHHDYFGSPRPSPVGDGMRGSALGPSYSSNEVSTWLESVGVPFERPSVDRLVRTIARRLATGKVVGWFYGPMEFGPRALGHRSILADPRYGRTAARLNGSIKLREEFRPFAPVVPEGRAAEYFTVASPSPYMLRTAPVRHAHTPAAEDRRFEERLASVCSPLAACTHVDGSARLQTVSAAQNPLLHDLLLAFEAVAGVPVLLNTSFNGRAEPIVRTPADAYRTFMRCGLDVLVIEGCVVER